MTTRDDIIEQLENDIKQQTKEQARRAAEGGMEGFQWRLLHQCRITLCPDESIDESYYCEHHTSMFGTELGDSE